MPDTTIHVGDSMPIEVSWFIPSPDNPYQESDATIIEATVRIIRNHDRKLVVDNASAEISGNETIYIVPELMTKGQHTAYVTATMNDDTTFTQTIEFYVK